MQKVFLDTNIWMRYFLGDEKSQYEQAFGLLEAIEEGKLQVYTSTIVLLEIHFVAKKLYKIPDGQIFLWFRQILKFRNLNLIEKTRFTRAIMLHEKYGVKLADCIIAAQVPVNCKLVTFDQEFKKIKEVKSYNPNEIGV